MSRQLSRKLQRTGRRGFLKTLASIGVSAPALKGLTQDEYDELIDDPRREVPRVLAFKAKDKRLDKQREKLRRGELPEREPVYYKITRSEWRRVESAHDARQRLENRLSHHSDSIGVMVTTNENATASASS